MRMLSTSGFVRICHLRDYYVFTEEDEFGPGEKSVTKVSRMYKLNSRSIKKMKIK